MKLFTILALLAGLLLFGYLLIHFGALDILGGVAAVGWGVLWVALYRLVTIFAHGMGWRILFPAESMPSLWTWFRARWCGEAVNSLLPVAQVGGEVARAQMVTHVTRSGALAGATVVVDFTLGLAAQLFYTVLGVVLLTMGNGSNAWVRPFATGLVAAAAALTGFWLVQHTNLLGRVAERFEQDRSGIWSTLAGGLADLNREAAVIYKDHRRIGACLTWRAMGWLLFTAETWLILYFLGHGTNWANALVLESLTMAIRSGAFALPGALGVQEAGFVLIGPLVGVSAEIALALALVKRLREFLVGVPGVWLWAVSEGKPLMKFFSKQGR